MSRFFHRSTTAPSAPSAPSVPHAARVPVWVLVEIGVAFLTLRRRLLRRARARRSL